MSLYVMKLVSSYLLQKHCGDLIKVYMWYKALAGPSHAKTILRNYLMPPSRLQTDVLKYIRASQKQREFC